jgi:hypothetical protein
MAQRSRTGPKSINSGAAACAPVDLSFCIHDFKVEMRLFQVWASTRASRES